MRGTPGSVFGLMGLLAACITAPPEGSADGGAPAQQEGDSGVQHPPPDNDAGSATDGGVHEPPPAVDAGVPLPSLDAGGPPPGADGGVLSFDEAILPLPPAPTPDDPAACLPQAMPFPSLDAQPDRPCTERGSQQDGGSWWTASYRYDARGRLVYDEGHSSYGDSSTYTLEEDAGVRIETWTQQGVLSFRMQDVTRLQDDNPVQVDHFEVYGDGGLVLTTRSTWQYDAAGRPAESDHFKADADGGLAPDGHTTWLYDDEGRRQYVISQYTRQTRRVERHLYDSKGHDYYVDVSDYWPGRTQLANHSFTGRSWFANGVQAHEYWTCDIEGGAPCGYREKRWEPCGNLSYDGRQTGNWRWSSFADWTWDGAGNPLKMHVRWNTTTDFFNTTETYQVDASGRVVSGSILTINPYGPVPTEQHEASYAYDDEGRLVDRSIDGNSVFHARFDAEGRLIELLNGTMIRRWTYDACGR